MKYFREIQNRNLQVHLDIESDIQVKAEGLFTFTIRVNNGNIADYSVIDYVSAEKYDGLTQDIIEELTAAYNNQQGNSGDTVRADHDKR